MANTPGHKDHETALQRFDRTAQELARSTHPIPTWPAIGGILRGTAPRNTLAAADLEKFDAYDVESARFYMIWKYARYGTLLNGRKDAARAAAMQGTSTHEGRLDIQEFEKEQKFRTRVISSAFVVLHPRVSGERMVIVDLAYDSAGKEASEEEIVRRVRAVLSNLGVRNSAAKLKLAMDALDKMTADTFLMVKIDAMLEDQSLARLLRN